MSRSLDLVWRMRDGLPAPARRAVRRATDPVLAPVGSLAGARVPAAEAPAAVGLTFDDGPDGDATPAVLDALARAGARATFFVLVDRAERHPDVVRRVVAEGHEVGLHGPDHRRLTTLAPAEVRRGLGAAKARLEDIAGVPVRWFRPPFGSQNLRTYVAARRVGLAPVVWTAEGADWEAQPPAQVAERVLERLRPGGIVLLHDGLAGDPRDPDGPGQGDPFHGLRGEVVDRVLERLAGRGLRPTSVGALVDAGRPQRSAWFRP